MYLIVINVTSPSNVWVFLIISLMMEIVDTNCSV